VLVNRSLRTFDLRALYDAIDARRQERNMTWAAVAREVNRFRTKRRPIAASTITGLRDRPVAEGAAASDFRA